jgi:nucleoside-diphosphate-sugar epimerase
MGGKVLIAGASGAAGSAALERFAREPGWEVIGVSRRPPVVPLGGARHLALDLLDREACATAFGAMRDVTHVVYAALNEREDDVLAGWRDGDQIAKNQAMLANLFDPLAQASPSLLHISLVHGGKAYGIHLPDLALPIPLRETQPRAPGENFYYRQEDYLAAKKRETGGGWSVTVLRPASIVGVTLGGSLSGFLVLAVFAALCREAGLDMPVPAGRGDIHQLTGASLVADALLWAAEAPSARDEAFNIADGDIFSIHDAFPLVAAEMGLCAASPAAFDLVEQFDGIAHLWPGMVEKYGLAAPADLKAMLGLSPQVARIWAEEVAPGDELRWNYCSTIKLRQAGFAGCLDSAEMLRTYLRRYKELKLIPDFG